MLNDTKKNMNDLKGYKKAQKTKSMARRVAAAEKSKTHKVALVVVSKETIPGTQKTPVLEETTRAENCSEHTIVCNDTTVFAQYPAFATTHILKTSSQIVDIHAHRKALEAALYNSMETPKQMLARLEFAITADAEFHQDILDDEALAYPDGIDFDDFSSTIKCLDDNGFEIFPVPTDLSADLSVVQPFTVDQPSMKLSIEQLFAMVSSTGAKKVGTSTPTTARTLESSESQQTAESSEVPDVLDCFHQGHSISIEQLFSAASCTNNNIVRDLETQTQSSFNAQKLDFIESKLMTTVCSSSMDSPAELFIPFVDPAIVSMKAREPKDATSEQKTIVAHDDSSQILANTYNAASEKLKLLLGIGSSSDSSSSSAQHSRSSSTPGDLFYTPNTHFSVSPPPLDRYGLGLVGGSCSNWYPGPDAQYTGYEYYAPAIISSYNHQYIHSDRAEQLAMATQPYLSCG